MIHLAAKHLASKLLLNMADIALADKKQDFRQKLHARRREVKAKLGSADKKAIAALIALEAVNLFIR